MARKRSWSSPLYKAARTTRTAEVWASGDPVKIARRYKNKWLGRNVIRKLWRWP